MTISPAISPLTRNTPLFEPRERSRDPHSSSASPAPPRPTLRHPRLHARRRAVLLTTTPTGNPTFADFIMSDLEAAGLVANAAGAKVRPRMTHHRPRLAAKWPPTAALAADDHDVHERQPAAARVASNDRRTAAHFNSSLDLSPLLSKPNTQHPTAPTARATPPPSHSSPSLIPFDLRSGFARNDGLVRGSVALLLRCDGVRNGDCLPAIWLWL